MRIRARRDDEIDACVALLADVHAADGYPLHWPADPPHWLAPDRLLAAWVAEDEQTVIGHVALCGAVGDAAAPLWSAASGLPPEQLAVVAKLFVAPRARGHGVGAALLAHAGAEARRRDLRPAIEVLDHDRGAIALYERTGWRRVASLPAPWASASGDQALLYYYLAPDVAVRLAAPEDALAIAEVLRAAFAEYAAEYTPEALAATTPPGDVIAGRMGEGPVWVAVMEGALAGTVAAAPRAEGLYVRSMAALPAARGLGVGPLLFGEIERYAGEHGFARLFLSTTPFLTRAIRLYESLGFRRTDDGPHALFGTPLVTMEKLLAPAAHD
jgi:GNAT superfamily N-acetyltransferase